MFLFYSYSVILSCILHGFSPAILTIEMPPVHFEVLKHDICIFLHFFVSLVQHNCFVWKLFFVIYKHLSISNSVIEMKNLGLGLNTFKCNHNIHKYV
uniref:Uncharacterized protein n=1 Tax=Anguilla anguilla TaxID=7936 RepID=A0A0E9X5Y2_ANGAN